MFFARFLAVLVSVLVSWGFWTLGTSLEPAKGKAAYAALICNEAISDREIRERLEDNGFSGMVSESGQWVLLDSFGSIEQIALDEYDSRILPFDPRNDGYAQKLRSLFVRNGKRYIYMPLGTASVRPSKLEKRLESVLGDIDFSLDAERPVAASRPTGFYLVLFCLAAAAFFAVRPLRPVSGRDATAFIPLLPALAPLALGGASGFALASLLAGSAALLAGPCLGWFAFQRHRSPPILCFLLLPLFLICYVTLAFFSALSLLFTLPLFVFFCGILAVSLQDAYSTATGNADKAWGALLFKRMVPPRRRFSPVAILRQSSFFFTFSWAMIPFATIGLVLACFEMLEPVPGPGSSFLPPSATVIESDYHAHYKFQSTFSFRSLHDPLGGGNMNVFEMNGGLPVQNGSLETDSSLAAIPPFPLTDLAQFLNTERQNKDLIPLACVVFFPLFFILQGVIVPVFLRKTTARVIPFHAKP
jgi:hypothetical protein